MLILELISQILLSLIYFIYPSGSPLPYQRPHSSTSCFITASQSILHRLFSSSFHLPSPSSICQAQPHIFSQKPHITSLHSLPRVRIPGSV